MLKTRIHDVPNYTEMSKYFGIIGAALYIGSYILLQVEIIDAGGIYTLANLFGAMFCLVSLVYAPNLGSIIVQVAWILFSVIGLIKQGQYGMLLVGGLFFFLLSPILIGPRFLSNFTQHSRTNG